jgi:membrane protease YdiL (CAAX protease family)
MQNYRKTYYPTTFEAVHLIVLYIFLQSLIDFPLALYDYQKDTNWLSNPWISFISNFTITILIFIYGYRKAKNKFSEVFALKTFNLLLIFPILLLLPGLQYLVGLLNVVVERIIPAPPWFWELFDRIFENHFGFWGAFVKVAVLAPIIEETFFRGIIMHGLMRNYKNWYAILLSGILFSVFHLNPWQMTYTFFLGLFLGFLMVRTRSLPLCILAHSINNIIVLYSVTTKKDFPEFLFAGISKSNSVLISIGAIFTGFLLIILITRRYKNSGKQIRQDLVV